MLTEKEQQFLSQYRKSSYTSNVILLGLAIVGATLQLMFVFTKLVPVYLKPFINHPEMQDFVRTGLLRCTGTSFIWIALLVGILIGNSIISKKIVAIFDKLGIPYRKN